MRMVFPPHATGRFINELTSDMNAIVESLFGEDETSSNQNGVSYTPRMDVFETEHQFELHLDLPGVNPDDIAIDLNDDTVTIHGRRQRETVDSFEGDKRRFERVFGEFRRTVQLPKLVDKDAVEADYTDGVLTVTIPKAAPVQAKKVTISRGRRTDTVAGHAEFAEGASEGGGEVTARPNKRQSFLNRGQEFRNRDENA